jgi:two-component system, LytTR family, response regulator
MKMRAIIADDESLARRRIRSLLAAEPDIQIVEECFDGQSASEAITKHCPEILFLDVQMPGMNGFEVLENVSDRHLPLTIFVTAFDKYAVRAFESHALDYLLKPFSRKRFFQALARARAQIKDRSSDQMDRILALLGESKPATQRLVVRSGGRLVLIRPEEIDWIEAAANYVCIHAGRNEYLVRETLGGFEKRLPGNIFARIHRSILVNIERIQQLEPCNGSEYVVHLNIGKQLPLGRSYRAQIEDLLRIR